MKPTPYILLVIASAVFTAIMWGFVRNVLTILEPVRLLTAFALYNLMVLTCILVVDKLLAPTQSLLTDSESGVILEMIKYTVAATFGYILAKNNTIRDEK